MTALRCDICREFYDPKEVNGKYNYVVLESINYGNRTCTKTDKNFDLCPVCCKKIAEIFHLEEEKS